LKVTPLSILAAPHLARISLPAFLIVVLSACGGGGSDGDASSLLPETGAGEPSFAGHQTDSLVPMPSFSDDDIRHFLARTHFGVEPGKVDEIQGRGLSAYLDDMLAFDNSDNMPFEQQAGALLVNDDDPQGLEGKFPSDSDIIEWNIDLLIENPNAFQEVMGMFWQDHFGIDVEALGNSEHYLMVDYINLLRENAVGDFRQLFLDVSRSGAMLIFLDGADNNKFAPNENFAREFWELFSLGVDNGYSEMDIIEAARAFTGWRRVTDETTGLTSVVFDPESKAVGSKAPLGTIVPHSTSEDDYMTMVDLTLMLNDGSAADSAALYLAEKILHHFVLEDPSGTLVQTVATSIAQHNYVLAPVLKELFLSQAFYSPAAKNGLVRDLYEQVVGLVRSTGLEEQARIYRAYLQNMGSIPGRPPSVEGWPEGDDKINVQGNGLEIANFVNELITNRSSQTEQGYDIGLMLQPEDAVSAEHVIDYVAELLGVQLDETDRSDLVQFMNTHYASDGEETPLYYTPANTDHQDRKLRNLLWILCQHPTFQIK